MSSGHANHKGNSTKPNVNANGQINADLPEDVQITEGSPREDEVIVNNPAATERPEQDTSDKE